MEYFDIGFEIKQSLIVDQEECKFERVWQGESDRFDPLIPRVWVSYFANKRIFAPGYVGPDGMNYIFARFVFANEIDAQRFSVQLSVDAQSLGARQ